ncbi:MAG: hypothetical protein ABR596_05515 [Halarsenatibacteraceae bacterium]
MKKYLTVILIFAFIFLFANSTQALIEPGVNDGQGHFMVNLVVPQTDSGFSIAGDYGINNNVGIFGEIGDPFSRLGLKYQLSPEFAVTGGYVVDNSIFIGLNTSLPASDNLRIAGELGLVVPEEDLALMYEIGAIYNLPENIDVRASANGISSDDNKFKLGFGYSF